MSIQYLLTNVKHDNSYSNVPYFGSEWERNATLIGDKEFTTTFHNFSRGNILYTHFVVNSYDNENYLIIKDNDKYYFYFVTDCNYLSTNQWNLSLEIDIFTNYIVGINSNTFSDCYVERGHVNRWKRKDNKFAFNVDNNSLLIQSETELEFITKERKVAKIKYTDNETVNDWLNDNILTWCYIFVDSKHNFKATKVAQSGTIIVDTYDFAPEVAKMNIDNVPLSEEFATFCFPIYKGYPRLYFVDDIYQNIGEVGGFEEFRKNNFADFPYIYNIKFSNRPPVNFSFINYIEIDESGNLNVYHSTTDEGAGFRGGWEIDHGTDYDIIKVMSFGNVDTIYLEQQYVSRLCNLFVNVNYVEPEFDEIEIDYKNEFDRNEIVGVNRSLQLEPKMYVDCSRVTLRDSSNGEYSYRPLHIDNNTVNIQYTEPNNITNTNYYYRLASSGIIPSADETNWSGVANTVDYSQQVANDNYATFLANNKNFLLNKTLSEIPNIVSLLAGDLSASARIGFNALNTGIAINTLRNKPNTMRCVNDSVGLNLLVNDGIKLYVDIEEVRDVDKEQYYNYLYSHGYFINRFCNPYDYINTRYYFNYLKCELEGINIMTPDNVTNRIREVFSRGVRIWNNYDQMYNYTKENYEKWLQ